MTDSETAYLLARAKEEADAATKARTPAASAVHQRLSVLYSAKAIMELGDEADDGAEADHDVLIAASGR